MKKYVTFELDIISLENTDVITNSGLLSDSVNDNDVDNENGFIPFSSN